MPPTHRPSLGRGLSSLIPDAAFGDDLEPGRGGLRQVPIEEISANPEQPREVFTPGELSALVTSIATHGIMTPLVVRRDEGRYVLIAGERRLRAAALAGLSDVPVIVREAPTAREQLELALVENLLRADLDPIECARGYQRLIDEYDLTQDEVAERVGRDRATVANAIRLLRLPAFVREALRGGHISAGHARALLPIADSEDVLRQTLGEVVTHGLSVRATEGLVRRRRSDASPKHRPERLSAGADDEDPAVRRVCAELSALYQTEVGIRSSRRGGRITLQYSSEDELDRLIDALRRGVQR